MTRLAGPAAFAVANSGSRPRYVARARPSQRCTQMTKHDHESIPYEASGFFVMRTPLLPARTLFDLSAGIASIDENLTSDELPGALERDRETVRARIAKIVVRPEVREALFLASPQAESKLDLWLRDPAHEKVRDLDVTLARYVSRMSSRSTPFGLFAGSTLGKIGSEARLELAGRSRYRRHTRIDTEYLATLMTGLAESPELRDRLPFRPNPSIHANMDGLRYVESRVENRTRRHRLIGLEAEDYLTDLLDRAREGAKVDELVAHLIETVEGVAESEARDFVDELVASQILVSDMTPVATGPLPLCDLISQLRGPDVTPRFATLDTLRRDLARLDRNGVGIDTAHYHQIVRDLEPLPAPADASGLFQVNLFKPAAHASLDRRSTEELGRCVDVLHRIAPTGGGDGLEEFVKAFTKRYGDREVPFFEALDEQSGIGFNRSALDGRSIEPLLADIDPVRAQPDVEIFGERDRHLLRKLSVALEEGAREIRLTDADIAALEQPDRLPLPDALLASATLMHDTDEGTATSRRRMFVRGASGPSGARLLGRFCTEDPELKEQVGAHLRAEEALRPEAVFAEVVHLPEGRLGNTVHRPVLREWEIPVLGRSGADPERQISLHDLTVSVVEGRVVLKSLRLDREVIPRMTAAHAFGTRGIGWYQFLGQLQSQGVTSGVAWQWGALESSGFLPRVVWESCVLARARWRLSEADLRPLHAADSTERFRAVRDLRSKRRLPRWIVVAESDRELPVDLDNILSVESLCKMAKGREVLDLHEFLFDRGEHCVRGPEGDFAHELIVPYTRRESKSSEPTSRPRSRVATDVRHRFPPSSEWLYVKAYCGPHDQDRVLASAVRPLVNRLNDSGAVDQFFFIRYADPDPHLRLRFRGDPARLLDEVLPELSLILQPDRDDRVVWKLQNDTYVREVDRYGGPAAIELAEEMFAIDTNAMLSLIEATPGDEGADARWRLAIRSIDDVMTVIGAGDAEKCELYGLLRDAYQSEYRGNPSLEAQIKTRYRKERRELEGLLDASSHEEHWLQPGLEILESRARRLRPLALELQSLDRDGCLTRSSREVATSLIHMSVNRLLRAAHSSCPRLASASSLRASRTPGRSRSSASQTRPAPPSPSSRSGR